MTTVLCAWVFGVGLVSSPGSDLRLERFQASELHMGTKFTVVLYANDLAAANRGLKAAFARIRGLDQRLSDYRRDSELNRLSNSAPPTGSSLQRPFHVSCDLWRILRYSQDLSRRTEGAFDVTVGPLSRLWRRALRRSTMPSPDRLTQALSAVSYQHMRLDQTRHTVTLLRPHMRLDLGGIAKGYATDEALKSLRNIGIDRAIVNAGGDMSIGRAPPETRGWKVGIAPLDPSRRPSRMLVLEKCAVATSGDTWQYAEIDGRRYSHIVDPHTGLGLTRRSSVTVVAGDGMSADSLASAVSVLGPQRGLSLVDQTPGACVLIMEEINGEIVTHPSRGFDRLLTADEPVRTVQDNSDPMEQP